jgi:hypothetical protein
MGNADAQHFLSSAFLLPSSLEVYDHVFRGFGGRTVFLDGNWPWLAASPINKK